MRYKNVSYYYTAIFAWVAMGSPILTAYTAQPTWARLAQLASVSCCQASAVALAILGTMDSALYRRWWALLEGVYIYGFISIFVLFIHFMPLGGAIELWFQCLFHYLLPVFLGGPLVYLLVGACAVVPTYALLEVSTQLRLEGQTDPWVIAVRAAWVSLGPLLLALVMHLSYIKEAVDGGRGGDALVRAVAAAVGWRGGGGGAAQDGPGAQEAAKALGGSGEGGASVSPEGGGRVRPPWVVRAAELFAAAEGRVYAACTVVDPKVLLLLACVPIALVAFVRQTALFVHGGEDCSLRGKPMETLIAMTVCFMLGTLEPQSVLKRQLGIAQALLYDLMPAHVAQALLRTELERRTRPGGAGASVSGAALGMVHSDSGGLLDTHSHLPDLRASSLLEMDMRGGGGGGLADLDSDALAEQLDLVRRCSTSELVAPLMHRVSSGYSSLGSGAVGGSLCSGSGSGSGSVVLARRSVGLRPQLRRSSVEASRLGSGNAAGGEEAVGAGLGVGVAAGAARAEGLPPWEAVNGGDGGGGSHVLTSSLAVRDGDDIRGAPVAEAAAVAAAAGAADPAAQQLGQRGRPSTDSVSGAGSSGTVLWEERPAAGQAAAPRVLGTGAAPAPAGAADGWEEGGAAASAGAAAGPLLPGAAAGGVRGRGEGGGAGCGAGGGGPAAAMRVVQVRGLGQSGAHDTTDTLVSFADMLHDQDLDAQEQQQQRTGCSLGSTSSVDVPAATDGHVQQAGAPTGVEGAGAGGAGQRRAPGGAPLPHRAVGRVHRSASCVVMPTSSSGAEGGLLHGAVGGLLQRVLSRGARAGEGGEPPGSPGAASAGAEGAGGGGHRRALSTEHPMHPAGRISETNLTAQGARPGQDDDYADPFAVDIPSPELAAGSGYSFGSGGAAAGLNALLRRASTAVARSSSVLGGAGSSSIGGLVSNLGSTAMSLIQGAGGAGAGGAGEAGGASGGAGQGGGPVGAAGGGEELDVMGLLRRRGGAAQASGAAGGSSRVSRTFTRPSSDWTRRESQDLLVQRSASTLCVPPSSKELRRAAPPLSPQPYQNSLLYQQQQGGGSGAGGAGLGGAAQGGGTGAAGVPQSPLSSSLPYAEWHDSVTLLFCDIVGFTEMSNQLPPGEVLEMLNRLYTRLDGLTLRHPVYKVDTVGDCYIAAAGLMKEDPCHADTILSFARAMRMEASKVSVPGFGPIRVRIGVHSGRVISGIVGNIRKKYSIFGDTANTASRMETLGEPGQIHVSHATYEAVRSRNPSDWTCRGEIEVKGKGRMLTWWYRYHRHRAASNSMPMQQLSPLPQGAPAPASAAAAATPGSVWALPGTRTTSASVLQVVGLGPPYGQPAGAGGAAAPRASRPASYLSESSTVTMDVEGPVTSGGGRLALGDFIESNTWVGMEAAAGSLPASGSSVVGRGLAVGDGFGSTLLGLSADVMGGAVAALDVQEGGSAGPAAAVLWRQGSSALSLALPADRNAADANAAVPAGSGAAGVSPALERAPTPDPLTLLLDTQGSGSAVGGQGQTPGPAVVR